MKETLQKRLEAYIRILKNRLIQLNTQLELELSNQEYLEASVTKLRIAQLNRTIQELENDVLKKNYMKLVGSKNGFEVYFYADGQCYYVYKDNKLVVGRKYNYSDVKSYLD